MTVNDRTFLKSSASDRHASQADRLNNLLLRLHALNKAQKREEALEGVLTEASIALDRCADELYEEMLRVASEIVASDVGTPSSIAAKANVVLFYAEADSEDIVHNSARALAKSILCWLPKE